MTQTPILTVTGTSPTILIGVGKQIKKKNEEKRIGMESETSLSQNAGNKDGITFCVSFLQKEELANRVTFFSFLFCLFILQKSQFSHKWKATISRVAPRGMG